MKKRWVLFFGVWFGFGVMIGNLSTASAQNDDAFTLEEITVTAEKREENQQKVAIPMEVFTGEDLQEMGRYDIDQILFQVSNAFISRTSEGLRVSLRGVGFDTPAGYGDGAINAPGTVSVNFDGVFSAKRPTGTGLYDIDRVEVLFGPQSTMYASNAPGGIVNIETAKPKLDTYEASGTLEYGNYHNLHGEAMINAPISDALAIRAAFNMLVHDGYLSNGADDENSKSGRLRILYNPTDKLSFLVTGEYETSTGFGYTSIPAFIDEGDVDDPWFTPIEPTGTPAHTTRQKLSAKIDYDLEYGILTMIPSYFDDTYFKTSSAMDWTGDILDQTSSGGGNEKGFEARFNSPDESKIKWALGFNWYRGENDRDQIGQYRSSGGNAHTAFHQLIKQTAFLGNVTIPVTSGFRVVAGIRYSDDQATSQRTIIEGPGVSVPSDMKHSAPSYKFGVEYDVADDIMVFANYATSYRVEGEASDWRGNAYPAQENKAYTLGSKMRFFSNKLQVNTSAFHYDYTNRIFMAMEMAPFFPPFPDEGGRAPGHLKSYGVDVQSTAILTSNDKLDLSVSYLHAEVTNLFFDYQFLPDVDYSNRTPTFSPEWTFNLAYSHNFDLPNGAGLTAKIDTRYQSEYLIEWKDQSLGLDYNGYKTQEAHHIDNVGLVYTSPDRKLTFTAYMKNIMDYAEKRFMDFPGLNMTIGSPRTYGFVLSVKY